MLKTLGPYRLERLIGRGGMGTVYAGVHEATGERAAIKLLSMALADDENFRARFLVEVETLKQLRHPNIVQILGDGEQDGQLFYVMELIEGKSLQELLQIGHPFECREVIRIAIEVCALKHAHDSGVIHRDLKPANLLRTTEGGIKLTDFGIAKLFGATHRTADGSVVGTADFMAPEQADSRPVTNRTDLYGLGAVMFTLLTRRTPFQGGTLPQVVHKLKYEEAPSVRRFAPDAPEELDSIIGELLRKDPRQRVATALVLANRLRALEHALLAQQDPELSPDRQPTRLAPPANFGNEKTSAGKPIQKPDTRLGPTHLDENSPRRDRDLYWNEATVKTSALSRPVDPSSSNPSPEPPSVESPPPQNRFTTIDEDQRRRADKVFQSEQENESRAGTIAGILFLFVCVIAACVWGLWPADADQIYQRIQTVSREKSPPDAMKDIELFLNRFPADPRRQEVDALRMDVESRWLDSRLRLRKRKTDGMGLEPYEQKWLEAYQLQEKDPEKSKAVFESILESEGQRPDPPPSLRIVLDATRHLLNRMQGKMSDK